MRETSCPESKSGKMALALKLCPLCSFEAPSVSIVLSHLRTVHASDPNYCVACGLDGCAKTSKSFSALYSHVYRHHPDFVQKRKEAFYLRPAAKVRELSP